MKIRNVKSSLKNIHLNVKTYFKRFYKNAYFINIKLINNSTLI